MSGTPAGRENSAARSRLVRLGLGEETDVAEVHPDQRHLGRPGQLGGPQQAAVAAEDNDELGALGGRGGGRDLLRARGGELARERADGDPRGGQPVGHEPGAAQRILPPGVRRHQHRPLSH